MFANLEQSDLPVCDYLGLFKLFFEWVLSSDQPNLVQHGHEQLTKLANRRPDIFRDVINPNLMSDVFTNTMHSNKKDMIILIGETLDILKHSNHQELEATEDKNAEDMSSLSDKREPKMLTDHDTEDLRRSIINVARSVLIKHTTSSYNNMSLYFQNHNLVTNFRSHLINILRDHGAHLEVMEALAKVYKAHTELLPVNVESRSWIANTTIKLLAGYK